MNPDWSARPLSELVKARPGNNKIIKGRESASPGPGLIQAYSASGPDVWVAAADYKEPGVVVSAVGARCGKTFMADGEWTAIANTHVLIPSAAINARWLWYRTNDESFWIKAGSAQPFVKVKETLLRPCKIPPLPEQQRIARILDEAWDGIATAKANAARNLQNANALFESHLQSAFRKRREGWERLTLETLLERGWIEGHLDGNHGSDYPRKEEFLRQGVPYISANCVVDERVDMSRAKYLSSSRAALLRKGVARANDVLFAHNATVGPVAILRTEAEKVILGTSLTYYRCNPRHILPEYLAHYMRSYEFKTQYLQVMRQSTRNQVPITKQREFWHVIPPIEDQRRMIRTLDGLLEASRRLVSVYERKFALLDALKKSLLQQAFSGQL